MLCAGQGRAHDIGAASGFSRETESQSFTRARGHAFTEAVRYPRVTLESVVRVPEDPLPRDSQVTALIDVGANQGQFGAEVRGDGYRGRLLSVEPLDSAMPRLRERCDDDPLWDCVQCAAGSTGGRGTLGVSGNSYSSSLLPILEAHLAAAPDARYGETQPVELRTLDSIVQEWGAQGAIGLKLDVQGYEAEVLAGAEATMPRVMYLETELSLVKLYQGQPLFTEMMERLAALGFTLVNLDPAFVEIRTGRALQFDGIFLRDPRRVAEGGSMLLGGQVKPEASALAKARFRDIYADGGWGGLGSGPGSLKRNARPYVDFVQGVIRARGVDSVVDVGCGDWQMWPADVFASVGKYDGYDVVDSVIESNTEKFGSPRRQFHIADATAVNLPAADLLLCKEVLQHLPNDTVLAFLGERSACFQW